MLRWLKKGAEWFLRTKIGKKIDRLSGYSLSKAKDKYEIILEDAIEYAVDHAIDYAFDKLEEENPNVNYANAKAAMAREVTPIVHNIVTGWVVVELSDFMNSNKVTTCTTSSEFETVCHEHWNGIRSYMTRKAQDALAEAWETVSGEYDIYE